MGQAITQQSELDQYNAIPSFQQASDALQSLTQSVGGQIQSQFDTLGAGVNLQSLIQVPEIDNMLSHDTLFGNHPIVQGTEGNNYNNDVDQITREIVNDLREKEQKAIQKLDEQRRKQISEIEQIEKFITNEVDDNINHFKKGWKYDESNQYPTTKEIIIQNNEKIKQEELDIQRQRRKWADEHYNEMKYKLEKQMERDLSKAQEKATKEVSNRIE